jgi:hypothetical protein
MGRLSPSEAAVERSSYPDRTLIYKSQDGETVAGAITAHSAAVTATADKIMPASRVLGGSWVLSNTQHLLWRAYKNWRATEH